MKKVCDCDPAIAKNYIFRVHAIILCQLLVVNLAVLWYYYATRIEELTRGQVVLPNLDTETHPIVIAVSAAVVLLIWIAMFLFAEAIQGLWPLNAILLGLFTLASAYLLVAVCAESQAPEPVANTVFIVTLLILILLVYSWLPCWTSYSFWTSALLALICTALLALWLILPAANDVQDAYLFKWHVDWRWILPSPNTSRDQAIGAIGGWITLLISLAFVWLFVYQLRGLTYSMKPDDAVRGAFCLYVSMMILLIFSVQTVASTLNNLASKFSPCGQRSAAVFARVVPAPAVGAAAARV